MINLYKDLENTIMKLPLSQRVVLYAIGFLDAIESSYEWRKVLTPVSGVVLDNGKDLESAIKETIQSLLGKKLIAGNKNYGPKKIPLEIHDDLALVAVQDTAAHPHLWIIARNYEVTKRSAWSQPASAPKNRTLFLLWSLWVGTRPDQLFMVEWVKELPNLQWWLEERPLKNLFFSEKNKQLLQHVHPLFLRTAYLMELNIRIRMLQPFQEIMEGLNRLNHVKESGPLPLNMTARLDVALIIGQSLSQEVVESEAPSPEVTANIYARAILQGKLAAGVDAFEPLLKEKRKLENTTATFFQGLSGIVLLAALYNSKEADHRTRFAKYLKIASKRSDFGFIVYLLDTLSDAREGAEATYRQKMFNIQEYTHNPLVKFFYLLTRNRANDPESKTDDAKLRTLAENAEKNGYHWFALEAYAALAERHKDMREKYLDLSQRTGMVSLFGLKERREEWQKSLEALGLLADTSAQPAKETRITWHIEFSPLAITPVEQVMNKGGWSKGKAMSLRRLVEEEVTGLSAQDQAIANAIRLRYGYHNSYFIVPEIALPAMVGHPLLFSGGVPIELVREVPSLLVDAKKDGSYEVRLSYEAETPGLRLVKETPTRYKLVQIEESHVRIYRQMGKGSLKVPPEGKEALAKVAGRLSGVVQVQSDLEVLDENMPKVAGDATIRVHIVPQGEGFRLETYVKPFKTDPPYVKPATGRENLIAEVGGKRQMAIRDLKLEKKNEQALLAASNPLRVSDGGNHQWQFESPEECLEVLADLSQIQDKVIIEWPEGVKLKIAGRVSMKNLTLRMARQKDWFAATGELKLDNGQVLSLLEIMRLLENSPGRFLQLSNGEFLALTGEFRKRLEEMRAWSDETKDGLKVHPLAAPAWEDAASAAGQFLADKHWKEKTEKLKTARTLVAKVPSTFQADMRPYQEEGFQWLAQLAAWGVGACLADDMGLGKTIQTLALLLYRAQQGPSLVVAPPTVARNWVAEAIKFSPSLNHILYVGKDREKLLRELGPFDVVITSYGLLQNDVETLAALTWNVAVLDEAQSIKNFQAKRSKAAMEIQAEFKMITTGTPIENHLGELWNLFAFINPGLLGSLQHFNERFATPIEKNQNQERRRHLQRLIQPFILRRRKSQVLDELPAKTEITLSVEMSAQEAAYYEAMRLHAVEKLAAMTGKTGEKQLQILAEIMRLRRFCCHPGLVEKEQKMEGSKMAVLAEVVGELRENGHKALIFSQFVGFLEIVRQWVESEGIPYQYLDGSTPQKQRETAIRQFQSGEGDVFLISLKAGGVGLNLTAADYVIHLDPWWNPAVEDQASDRAHRIGQERPVTIYRLVSKGTIEEKIVNLHHQKRDLADSLLEGTDTSSKLSLDALLKLISEE